MAGTNCPACGLRCVFRMNEDSIECPEHGIIYGILLMQIKGMDQVDALIEIMAAQRLDWSRRAFDHLRQWLYNDSYLKIRAPL